MTENAETSTPAPVEYDEQLVADVRAAQLSICTQEVPEALQLRLAAAAAVPAGRWRRNAGASDPQVRALEAPFRRTPIPGTRTPAAERRASKATGSRRGRNQKRS